MKSHMEILLMLCIACVVTMFIIGIGIKTDNQRRSIEMSIAYQENLKASLDLINKRSELQLQILNTLNERMEQSQ
jgi:biotin-(acetyl-CoA carboxylase) ligase